MKLYYSPGTCSLAPRIALIEAGLPFEGVAVDLRQRTVEDGRSLKEVNAKGYLPVLELDDGRRYTESVAVLDWIAARCPSLGVPGEDGRTRLIEMLAFLSTEVHKQFTRVYFPTCDAERALAVKKLGQRFQWLAGQLQGDYLFGAAFTTADAYLYVMLTWAGNVGLDLPPALTAFAERVAQRPAVVQACSAEPPAQKA
jgi:glutathione S-transferase